MAVPVGQGAPDQENRPPQPFSWAQRRRNDKRDLDEFQRVEQLVTRSAAPKRPAAAQRPRPEGLVHRFYQTASSSVPAPDDVRGLVPGLESRRELNAATKAELGRLRAKIESLTSELASAREQLAAAASNAVAAADCALLAKQNAKLRERNRELLYQVKQLQDRAASTADSLEADKAAFAAEKAKHLKEVRKQKAELDRQAQLALQAQLPDRHVRERVEAAEQALRAVQDRSHASLAKLKAEISRQKLEIDNLKEANSQLRLELHEQEKSRIAAWAAVEAAAPRLPRPDGVVVQRHVRPSSIAEAPPVSLAGPPDTNASPVQDQNSLPKTEPADDVVAQRVVHPGGKVVTRYSDGTKVIEFPNGAVKTVNADGIVVVRFANGDERKIFADREEYRYKADGILHVTLASGVQTFDFASGQKEVHYPDGSKQITFPDGVVKVVQANGDEEVRFCNGLVHRVVDGKVSVHHPNRREAVDAPKPQLPQTFAFGQQASSKITPGQLSRTRPSQSTHIDGMFH
ncbi:Centromere protein J C-terminal domain-containing protein [Plasmodiophora brassicae]